MNKRQIKVSELFFRKIRNVVHISAHKFQVAKFNLSFFDFLFHSLLKTKIRSFVVNRQQFILKLFLL